MHSPGTQVRNALLQICLLISWVPLSPYRPFSSQECCCSPQSHPGPSTHSSAPSALLQVGENDTLASCRPAPSTSGGRVGGRREMEGLPPAAPGLRCRPLSNHSPCPWHLHWAPCPPWVPEVHLVSLPLRPGVVWGAPSHVNRCPCLFPQPCRAHFY